MSGIEYLTGAEQDEEQAQYADSLRSQLSAEKERADRAEAEVTVEQNAIVHWFGRFQEVESELARLRPLAEAWQKHQEGLWGEATEEVECHPLCPGLGACKCPITAPSADGEGS